VAVRHERKKGLAEWCGGFCLFGLEERGRERDDSLSGNMMVSCAVASLALVACAGEYLVASGYVTHAGAAADKRTEPRFCQSHDHGCRHHWDRAACSLCDFLFFIFLEWRGSVCQIMSARGLAFLPYNLFNRSIKGKVIRATFHVGICVY